MTIHPIPHNHGIIIIVIVIICGQAGISEMCRGIKCLDLTLLQSNFDPSEFHKSFHIVMMRKTAQRTRESTQMIMMEAGIRFSEDVANRTFSS